MSFTETWYSINVFHIPTISQVYINHKRTLNELPGLFKLTRDIVTDNVLGFCERADVANVLQVNDVAERFQLNMVFCPEHGTRLDHCRGDSQRLDCKDCFMAESDRYRCEHCDEFFLFAELVGGICGKRFCRPTPPCRACGQQAHLRECRNCPSMKKCATCSLSYYCTDCVARQKMFNCMACKRNVCSDCIHPYLEGFTLCDECDEDLVYN